MASVSSLDQDMRSLRMSRYTPAAAEEARTWIEATLGERLPPGDLLEALRDGVALCRLINLVLPPPGVKYKSSAMPFVQMENISHFLKACEMAPLSLPAHDRFLTVDLYESKDPAQVLQCLAAFSRQAQTAKPNIFRTTMGPKKTGAGAMSPTNTGGYSTNGQAEIKTGRPASPTKFSTAVPGSGRGISPAFTGGSSGASKADSGPGKSQTGPVSSWSKRSDEGSTAPAWNIHQYGYMGGASQGNQGIAFGARRQIIGAAPAVPSLAEKERLRKEKVLEEERQRQEAEEAEYLRKLELAQEEERARADEARRWEEETRRIREAERNRLDEQKRQWEEQEKRWKNEEESRRREEADLISQQKKPPEKPRVPSSGVLRGQTLSQYQKEQASIAGSQDPAFSQPAETPEQARVRELEKQLEEARERERLYQAEREEKMRQESGRSGSSNAQAEMRPPSAKESEASWTGDERENLRREWQKSHETTPAKSASLSISRPSLEADDLPSLPTRPLPHPTAPHLSDAVSREEEATDALPPRAQPGISESTASSQATNSSTPSSSPFAPGTRPLPDPEKESHTYSPSQNRTGRFLATNPAPSPSAPRVSSSQEAGDTSLEQQRDRDARLASQQKTKAGGWASKSLLEREMERERERQREWEANQESLANTKRDTSQGGGAGQSWDVNQYGFMGGDNMNRGSGAGSGINIGAGRRQILGPREMGGAKKT